MPSLKTAEKEVKEPKAKMMRCEVIKAIGIDATKETVRAAQDRAETKGLRFQPAGLTTMIYPSKQVMASDGKSWIPGEPVFIDLEVDVARKLQKAGAVRVDF